MVPLLDRSRKSLDAITVRHSNAVCLTLQLIYQGGCLLQLPFGVCNLFCCRFATLHVMEKWNQSVVSFTKKPEESWKCSSKALFDTSPRVRSLGKGGRDGGKSYLFRFLAIFAAEVNGVKMNLDFSCVYPRSQTAHEVLCAYSLVFQRAFLYPQYSNIFSIGMTSLSGLELEISTATLSNVVSFDMGGAVVLGRCEEKWS